MGIHSNLDGTGRKTFTLGRDQVIGVKIDDEGNVILFDIKYGQATLTEMMQSASSIIETRGIITRDGGLVHSRPRSGGPIDLVVQNP